MEKTLEQPEVVVLLSAYNGEKYIKQQIDSILGQEGVKVTLIVRDDGSNDGTYGILEGYEQLGKLQFVRGENKGFVNSFWDLVMNAPKAPYYAFSDQDDVWLKNKLRRAVDHLQKQTDKPMLYCANYFSVDEQLKKGVQGAVFSMEGWLPEYFILTQTPALGNTMVWNYVLQQKVKQHPECDWSCEHDHRMQFAAAMLGEIIIDKERTILYRQHSNNVSGGVRHGRISMNWLKMRSKRIGKRLLRDKMHRHSSEIRARNFLQCYRSELSETLIENLELVSHYRESVANTIRLLKSDMCKTMPPRIKLRIVLHCL